jgi:hypothetical protein
VLIPALSDVRAHIRPARKGEMLDTQAIRRKRGELPGAA